MIRGIISPYVYVAITVLSTVFSQLLFKKGVNDLPAAGESTFKFILNAYFLNGYIALGLFFSVLSILSWLLALEQIKLSHAYPFMSLTFPLVLLFSAIILQESIPVSGWAGIGFIVIGLVFVSRG
jgi:uncharacterized membrane protein